MLSELITLVTVEKRKLLEIYALMVRSRILDQTLLQSRKDKENKPLVFSGIGQEAGPATIVSLLKERDYLLPHYRGYAAVLAKGVDLRAIVAEVYGKKTGIADGIGGFTNYPDPVHHVSGHGSVMGSVFPAAVGHGLAARYRKDGSIVAAFFGDGSATRGTFWGSLALSTLWKLPILWVCENNAFSLSTRSERLAVTSLTTQASAMGVKARRINGNSVLEIFGAAKKAIARVRAESQPFFLELATYRVTGHDSSDSQWYQSLDEIKLWRKKDPLVLLRDKLFLVGYLTPVLEREIAASAKKEVEEAIDSSGKEKPITVEEFFQKYDERKAVNF